MLGHWGVEVPGKCPFKWPAEMSPGRDGIVSDVDVARPTRGCRVEGPSASRYFLMVALWIPNSYSTAAAISLCAGLSVAPSISPSEGTSACAERWLWVRRRWPTFSPPLTSGRWRRAGNGSCGCHEKAKGPALPTRGLRLLFGFTTCAEPQSRYTSESLFTISSGLAPRRREPPFAGWY